MSRKHSDLGLFLLILLVVACRFVGNAVALSEESGLEKCYARCESYYTQRIHPSDEINYTAETEKCKAKCLKCGSLAKGSDSPCKPSTVVNTCGKPVPRSIGSFRLGDSSSAVLKQCKYIQAGKSKHKALSNANFCNKHSRYPGRHDNDCTAYISAVYPTVVISAPRPRIPAKGRPRWLPMEGVHFEDDTISRFDLTALTVDDILDDLNDHVYEFQFLFARDKLIYMLMFFKNDDFWKQVNENLKVEFSSCAGTVCGPHNVRYVLVADKATVLVRVPDRNWVIVYDREIMNAIDLYNSTLKEKQGLVLGARAANPSEEAERAKKLLK